MISSPYLLLAKIAVLGCFLGLVWLGGYRVGKNGVQADWDNEKAHRMEAEARVVQAHMQELAEERRQQNETNLRVSNDHERELGEIRKKYDADLAAMRSAGGLRIPKSTCSSAAGTTTETPGASGHHDAATDSIPLLGQTSNDLYSLALEADTVLEQARACQNWIKENGFYGEKPSSP